MGQKFEVEVLVVGGDDKKSSAPPLRRRHKLEKFHSQLQTPFDIEDEEEIKKYLRNEHGAGYYRVYSPGHYEAMKTWFKGWVDQHLYEGGDSSKW